MALSELIGRVKDNITRLPGLVGDREDALLMKDLDDRLEKAREARRPYEGQWLMNTAFYFNKQWVIWSSATQQLERPNLEPWRVMPNINFVRPAILTTYAKIARDRQSARTQPASSSQDDETAARACDKFLDYLWPVSISEEAMRKTTIWMLITGTGLLKPCWDKTWGPVVGQQEVEDEDGNTTTEDVHLGNVQVYTVSPFDFYLEPGATEIEEALYCFHVTLRPASYIKKTYGVDVTETDYDNTMTFESQLKYIITGDSSRSKGVILKEYYERPNADNPEGRCVIYVNDQIISDTANPYQDDPLPFIPIRGNPRPDSFWGISYVDDMIDPQRIYNKTKGEAIEIQRTMSKPKYLIPIGSISEGKEITNAPGEDLRYIPVAGQKPEPIKGVDIPTGYFKLLEATRQELYDTSGQHEISHGQSPFTRTAAGIAYLQEQDDTRLGPMIRNYDRGFEYLEEMKLRIARQYYQEDRTLTVLGKDNKTEVFVFYRDQIPNDIHVRIQAGGQALPRSRVARQDLILKLWTTQPPILDDPKLVLKMLEFGEIEGIYDDVNRDISQAGRENDLMTQEVSPNMPAPQPPAVKPFHNHLVHIKEHNKIRNSTIYEDMPPPQQESMDYHVSQHEQLYTQQIQNAQANMQGNAAARSAAVGGRRLGPGGPGRPAAPGVGARGGGPRQMGTGLGPLMEATGPAGQHTEGNPAGMPETTPQ